MSLAVSSSRCCTRGLHSRNALSRKYRQMTAPTGPVRFLNGPGVELMAMPQMKMIMACCRRASRKSSLRPN